MTVYVVVKLGFTDEARYREISINRDAGAGARTTAALIKGL